MSILLTHTGAIVPYLQNDPGLAVERLQRASPYQDLSPVGRRILRARRRLPELDQLRFLLRGVESIGDQVDAAVGQLVHVPLDGWQILRDLLQDIEHPRIDPELHHLFRGIEDLLDLHRLVFARRPGELQQSLDDIAAPQGVFLDFVQSFNSPGPELLQFLLFQRNGVNQFQGGLQGAGQNRQHVEPVVDLVAHPARHVAQRGHLSGLEQVGLRVLQLLIELRVLDRQRRLVRQHLEHLQVIMGVERARHLFPQHQEAKARICDKTRHHHGGVERF